VSGARSSEILRHDWGRAIHAEVTAAVGAVPILVVGSRALGSASPESDCDAAVVLPLWKIPLAMEPLDAAARRLGEALGVAVSLNPLPKRSLRHPGGNLYLRKLRSEGRRLGSDGSLSVRPCSSCVAGDANERALTSYLLSAVNALLRESTPEEVHRAPLPQPVQHALLKAVLHLAQVRLLTSGRYESTLEACLLLVDDAELSDCAARPADPETFTTVGRLLRMLLGDDPITMGVGATALRNGQYAVLSALRGRARISAASRGGVEAALARASILLLEALCPANAAAHEGLVRRASAALPRTLRPDAPTWFAVRSVVVQEWPSAHPLVGLV
jgi:hypothetical protein